MRMAAISRSLMVRRPWETRSTMAGGNLNLHTTGAQGFFCWEPDATGAVFAGVTVADVGGVGWHELAAVDGVLPYQVEHGAEVAEGTCLGGGRVDFDLALSGTDGGMERFVERRYESFAAGDSKAGMLGFAYEGFEGFDFDGSGAQGGPDGFAEGVDLRCWKFNGAVETVEDPAQDFLSGVPDAFPIGDELLEGDGFFPGVAGGSRWWEDLVDGMEQGPGVVADHLGVGGLEETHIVVAVDLDELVRSGQSSLGQGAEAAAGLDLWGPPCGVPRGVEAGGVVWLVARRHPGLFQWRRRRMRGWISNPSGGRSEPQSWGRRWVPPAAAGAHNRTGSHRPREQTCARSRP